MLFVRGFGRTPPEIIGDSKTEFNRILCTSKSEAAVTSNKKNCTVGMLKLTTDKHEASRGLSASAELLVSMTLGKTLLNKCMQYRAPYSSVSPNTANQQ